MRVPLILVGALLPCAGWAGVIHVPADQPTLQAGINAAGPGDTVLVAPGVYTGPGNRNLDFAGKAVILRSSVGPAATIIDCQGAGRGFDFHSGETAASVVEGFTIRNGHAALAFGGGLTAAGASPTVRNCAFESNSANTGGAIFLAQSNTQVSTCSFSNNSADNWAGALHCENSSPVLTNCVFTANSAGFGGALSAQFTSSLTLQDCTFTGNMGANSGGAMYCRSSVLDDRRSTYSANSSRSGGGICCVDGASASLDGCSFEANLANKGAGIFCEGAASLQLTGCSLSENETTAGTDFSYGGAGVFSSSIGSISLTDCVFTDNAATGPYALGGGLYVLAIENPPLVMNRCSFIRNSADVNGGGAYFQGETHSLTDCMFVDNIAQHSGGAIVCSDDTLAHCSFIGNRAGAEGGAIKATYMAGRIEDCVISNNHAGQMGGGISHVGVGGTLELVDVHFSANSSPFGGAIFMSNRTGVAVMRGCTIDGNSATSGGGLYIVYPVIEPLGPILIEHCTIAANTASLGAGLRADVPVSINNTIIAFNREGAGIDCGAGGHTPVLACADIFGNEGGDWTPCIEDQFGVNGCFAEDPLFCNPGAGDYTLAESSPCSPAHSPGGCGLIGALPVGCVTPIGVGAEGAPAVSGTTLRAVPNPVAGEGLVEWLNAAPRSVALRLYDPAGRLVAARDLGVRAAGVQRERWADLVRGRRLPAGAYFLEVEGVGPIKVLVTR